MTQARDHGGALDAACARWGGARGDWVDLSTGINPVPYPVPNVPLSDWCALPDSGAINALEQAARTFWSVPDNMDILAAPGASCLIAALPRCLPGRQVNIRPDTYNEHAAAFTAAGWDVSTTAGDVQVIVHPNNPTGTFDIVPGDGINLIDESFCDTAPLRSFVQTAGPNYVILKSFGKFWGLAGLRLGFAIATPETVAQLRKQLGPWPVSGPALRIATAALNDANWAAQTRIRLAQDADRLDRLMAQAGATGMGDCPLFRLYQINDAAAWHAHFAQYKILSRVFPYNRSWLRLGLPAPHHWSKIERACGTVGGAMAQPSVVKRP